MTSTGTAGLSSFAELVRSMTRLGWLALAGLIVGVTAATVLTSDARQATATARIGLTNEVKWPFYNAARQRVAGLADGLTPAEVLGSDAAAAKVKSVDIVMPPDETFINVSATADDVATAVAAADAYAERLVALDAESRAASDQVSAKLADVKTRIADLTKEIEAAQAAIKPLLEAQAEAEANLEGLRNRSGVTQSALVEATLARDDAAAAVTTANNEADRLDRRLSNLEVDRDQLELEESPSIPEVELLRSAVSEEIPASPLRTRQLLGGITGAVVAAMAGWVIDRSFGIIRTPAALRSATELPVIDARWQRGAGRLAIWLDRLSNSDTIGFIGSSEWIGTFLRQLQPFLLEPAVVSTPPQAVQEAEREGADGRMLVALGQPSDGHWFDRGVGICDEIVLLVLVGKTRPVELQKLIHDVTALGSSISIVVLLDNWAERGRAQSRLRTSRAEAA